MGKLCCYMLQYSTVWCSLVQYSWCVLFDVVLVLVGFLHLPLPSFDQTISSNNLHPAGALCKLRTEGYNDWLSLASRVSI
jgi:hypothetical protein